MTEQALSNVSVEQLYEQQCVLVSRLMQLTNGVLLADDGETSARQVMQRLAADGSLTKAHVTLVLGLLAEIRHYSQLIAERGNESQQELLRTQLLNALL